MKHLCSLSETCFINLPINPNGAIEMALDPAVYTVSDIHCISHTLLNVVCRTVLRDVAHTLCYVKGNSYIQESTVLFGHSLDFHLWKRYLIFLVCNSVPNNQTALPSNTDKWFRTQTSVWVVLLIVCSSRRKKKNKEEEVEQEEVEQGWRRRKRKECHYNNEMRNQSFCLYSGNEAKSCMCGCL